MAEAIAGYQLDSGNGTYPRCMGLSEHLRRLDSSAFKVLRRHDEPAEAFLRRVAERRWPTGRHLPAEVQQALREFFAERDAG